MKHNKIFAFLLAGVLSLGIVGCGSAGSSDSSRAGCIFGFW